MRKSAESGIPNGEGGFIKKVMLIVVMVCVLFIVFASVAKYAGQGVVGNIGTLGALPNQGASAPVDTNKNNPLLSFLDNPANYGSASAPSGYSSDIPAASRSPYAGSVSLGSGNASYSIQPFEEYVTLRNNGTAAVDITGWTLTNSKGTRPIQNSGNNYFYPSGQSATIGQGTEFLDPSGNFQIGDIVMRPGDNAIVTTGQPFSQFPFSIYTSFRENSCDGFLKKYPFEPPLSQSCPTAAEDPQSRFVTDECYTYLQSLSRCEDPSVYDKANHDLETTQCQNFMDQRLNYPGCVAFHKNDPQFSQSEWRIFLGQKAELWAAQRETITLYDRKGLIVDQVSY